MKNKDEKMIREITKDFLDMQILKNKRIFLVFPPGRLLKCALKHSREETKKEENQER